ncbi:sce7726 family protein [Aeromonas schubertii]
MGNAEDIKLLSLDYIPRVFGGVMMFEFPFLNGRRRTDIICSDNNHLIAFEIKSDFDSLATLREQINDYKKCFNSTYIICGEKHLQKIKGNKELDVGIILIRNNEFILLRKAKIRVRLDIRAKLSMCELSFLKKISNKKNKSDIIDDILSGDLTIKHIDTLITQHIYNRVSSIYKLYLNQREQLNNYEKLMMLSLRRHVIDTI